jgi:hypothetical protein
MAEPASNVVPLENMKLKAALFYARLGWQVIPLCWPIGKDAEGNDQCACHKNCGSNSGKRPIWELTPHGCKNGTTDPETIKGWWGRFPDANIAIVTGKESGVVVVDIDGEKGRQHLAGLAEKHRVTLPLEGTVKTGRDDGGMHRYFQYPPERKVRSVRDQYHGIEIKSDDGYVVAPLSLHRSGKGYEWINFTKQLPELPQFLSDYKPGKPASRTTGELVDEAIVKEGPRSPPDWSEAEEEKLRSALAAFAKEAWDPRDGIWLHSGFALSWLRSGHGWEERPRQIWDEFSRQSDKYEPAEQDRQWEHFQRQRDPDAPVVTIGTIYHRAKEHGWQAPAPDEIAELNEKHFVVKIGGKVLIAEWVPRPVEMGTGYGLALYRVNDFKILYANRWIVWGKDNHGHPKLRKLGDVWIEHPQRRQHEGVVVDPTEPPITANNYLNLWRGFGETARPGKWLRVAWHIRYVLADGDDEAALYILRWLAWKIQNPGKRPEVVLVFRGGKGSGKGIIARAFALLIFGEHGLQIASQKHLTGHFNAHFRNCLCLFADEAFWAGDKAGESILKALITEPFFMLEQKGVDAIPWPNRLGMIMASNNDWVVPASHDERRYAVFDVSNRYAFKAALEEVRKKYFRPLDEEMRNGGLAAMLYDLKTWDLGDWHPRQIYETEALRRQKRQSMPPKEKWLVTILEDGHLPGSKLFGEPYNFAATTMLLENAGARVPQLKNHWSEQDLGDFLEKWGCDPHRHQRLPNRARGYIFPSLHQMRAQWIKRYSGWRWKSPELNDWQIN